MTNPNPQHVVTGRVRLSYVHLFVPRIGTNGGDPKYGATILLPKSDIATKQRIDAAIQAAIAAGVSSRWNGARPPQVATPIHDGDGVRPSDGMPFSDECKGHWVFTASSKQAPQVVDLGLNPIIQQTDVYSGMYARVSINFFPYATGGKKGIGCGLRNVQKVDDGEPLGGRTNAADDFSGAPGYYQPAQPAYQPQAPAYPQQPTYPQQPVYPAPVQPAYPQQPAYQPVQPTYAPVQPQQYDPITGAPIPPGGVMGL